MSKLASEIRADRARLNLSQTEYGNSYGAGRATVAVWESDGPGLCRAGIRLADKLASSDAQFREFVLEMAQIKRSEVL